MDPYAWQRHSLSILHDHPYCRPPYLEPVNSICVEPAFTKDTSKSKQSAWHISAARILKRLRKTLTRAALEISVCDKQMFQATPLDAEFRRASQRALIRQRVSRSIRKVFGYLHWKVERFPYGEFVEWIKTTDFSNSIRCQSNQQSQFEPVNGFSPISVMPSMPISEAGVTIIGRQPSSMADSDEPIFVCVMLASQAKSLRITRLMRDLSSLGRVLPQPIPEDACEAPRLRMRCLNQRLLALMDQNRPVPLYLVGFGITCPLMITAALQLPASYNNYGLEKVLCGRPLGLESPAPSRPWLSGLICLGMPLTLPSHQLEVLAAIGRRCSLLLLVGGCSRFGGAQEASRFRDSLIAARRRAPQPSELVGVGAAGGEIASSSSKPNEFDLQLLVVGGADHLLRLHTSTARRWSITQAAVDYALIVAMKNFVYACRNLSISNCESTEVQTSFTPALRAPSITGSVLHMQPRQVCERGTSNWRPPPLDLTSAKSMQVANSVQLNQGYHQQQSQLYRQTDYENLQSFRQKARRPSDVTFPSSKWADKRNAPGFGVSSWEGVSSPSQHRYQPAVSEWYGETIKRKASEGALLTARARPNKRLRRQSTLISQTKSSPTLHMGLRESSFIAAREPEGRDPYAFECGGDGDSEEGDPSLSPRRQPESSRFPLTLTFSQAEKSVPASSQEPLFRSNTVERTPGGEWNTGSPSYLRRC